MAVVTLEEAQAKLAQLIHELPTGSRIEVVDHGVTIATIIREGAPQAKEPRPAGTAKDRILWIAPDFNAPLDDFAEYME